MGRLRYGLEGVDEAAITRAMDALGAPLLNLAAGPRELTFGLAEWQATFRPGDHVEVRGHDAEGVVERLASHLSLGPPLACPPEAPAPEAPAPRRPRLAETVRARAHVIDGEPSVRLRDVRDGREAVIDPAVWDVLRHADGTRDRDALTLAAGRWRSLDGVARWLADGLPAPRSAPPVAPAVAAARPIEALPGYALRCDGSGGCCGAYGAVPFTAEEAARAEGLVPLGLPRPLRFTPYDAGGDRLAPAQVDRSCVFFAPEVGCRIHAAGGARAKPAPCQLYPATLVDDGVAVRLSVAPECACAFESADHDPADGVPLLPPGMAAPPARPLPEPVPLSPDRAAPRAELAAWCDALFAHLEDEPRDLAAFANGLAARIDARGLDPDLSRAPLVEAPLPPELAARLARAGAESDAARAVLAWAATAAAASGWPEPAHPERERFYLRALAWGRRLAPAGRPLSAALRERAARIRLARSMGATPAPALARAPAHPLAALEGALRHASLRLTDPPQGEG